MSLIESGSAATSGSHRLERDTASELRYRVRLVDPNTLDAAAVALLEARAEELRQWARRETEHIAGQ
jgi:hypothetical protein